VKISHINTSVAERDRPSEVQHREMLLPPGSPATLSW